jgi:hypothetical protein
MRDLTLTDEELETKQRKHAERKRENLRRWRMEHPEKAIAWQRKNRKKINARQKAWEARNADKVAASKLKRRKKILAYNKAWHRRQRAIKNELLSALQALLSVADHPDNPMRTGANASIIADARQAIAKATGQGGAV